MAEQRRRNIDRAAQRIHSDFASCMRGPGYNDDLTHPPRWEHARFDNAEFRKRSSKKIVGAVERWSPENGCLLICAYTGAGKTAAALAWLYRARDAAIAKVRLGEEGDFPSFSFITGHELANCRRRWTIGEESPLMKLATRVEMLVLDDLGCEPWPNEETFEIFDHRYRAGRRMIVTTGLSVASFRGRYGEAIYRRIIEPGAVVEAMQ